MKKIALLVVFAAVLVSSSTFAQGLTRAEVRQQLVTAEQNGSRFVTDASYPAVASIYSNEVAQKNSDGNVYGGVAAGTSASSSRGVNASNEACVGPASFCDLYKSGS